nr:hypothetical protein Q903MT_gene3585 [Picea sitchensis]
MDCPMDCREFKPSIECKFSLSHLPTVLCLRYYGLAMTSYSLSPWSYPIMP